MIPDSNRLADRLARLQPGPIFPLLPGWLLVLDTGSRVFGDYGDFPVGPCEQDPIFAFEGHLVHGIRRGSGASLDFDWPSGGQQTIGGEEREDLQQNARIGATLPGRFVNFCQFLGQN